jgi:hypothetical protein
MAEEFVINSSAIESKINQLLPSQGGFQPGVDFSASTMVIPIVDLTETAEGSSIRQDLQSALYHNGQTVFNTSDEVDDIIITTGYFRVFGTITMESESSAAAVGSFILNDGATDKVIFSVRKFSVTGNHITVTPFDFIVFLGAGDKLSASSGSSLIRIAGSTRQLADISGNLVSPT